MENDDVIKLINKELEDFRGQHFNVPGVSTLTRKPDGMAPIINLVNINPNPVAGQVYPLPGGKLGIGKGAILLFQIAGKIDFHDVPGGARVDDGKDPDIYIVKQMGSRFDLNGQKKTITDEKSINFKEREKEKRAGMTSQAGMNKIREDHPRWSESQIAEYIEQEIEKFMTQLRKFAHEKAVTGAQERIVIKLLGLKPSYTKEELAKPFVVVSVVPELDMSDPYVKGRMVDAILGITPGMFPAGAGIPSYMPAAVSAETLPQVAHEEPRMLTHVPEGDFENYPRAIQEMKVRSWLEGKKLPLDQYRLSEMSGLELGALYKTLQSQS